MGVDDWMEKEQAYLQQGIAAASNPPAGQGGGRGKIKIPAKTE
jgi:hypothetical protein